MTDLYLHGIGHFHPENVIDNAFLESLNIETDDQWIMDRVGIKARRTVLPLDYIARTYNKDIREAPKVALYSNAETGKRAAELALERANLKPENIGLVIAGGCAPDTVTPPEASRIACELGLQVPCVDLNVACSSFGAQMHWLSLMRPEAMPDYILLVQTENTTRVVDFSDRRTAVLWGDGSSAAILSTKKPSKVKIKTTTLTSNPSGWDKVLIPRIEHFRQDGSAVQGFAIRTTTQCLKALQEQYPERVEQLYFIGHQANLRMLESVSKRCGIKKDRHLFNVDNFGNQGAAGAPIVLSQNWSKFKPGDFVALVVVGAGLTWSSMAIEFE